MQPQTYQSAWRDLRLRHRLYRIAVILTVIFLLLTLAVSPLGLNQFSLIGLFLFIVSVLSIEATYRRSNNFRCPRCVKYYLNKKQTDTWLWKSLTQKAKCQSCGLEYGVEGSEMTE